MASQSSIDIAKPDLIAAWAVLENLTVSLDQIGGKFAKAERSTNGSANELAFHEALAGYLSPELLKAINDARTRLSQYLTDQETDEVAESIPYWNYPAPSEISR